MQCLENIIGITREDCECFTDGLSPETLASMRESVSGLYMDELEGAPNFSVVKASASNCTTMAEMMLRSLEIAKKETMDAVILEIQSYSTQSKDSFVGQIGQMSASQSLAVTHTYVGQRWRGWNGDGVVKIKAAYVYVDSAITSALRIIRAYKDAPDGEEILARPFTTIANTVTNVDLGGQIRLPLIYNREPVDYYFVYDRQTALPKNNKMSCNCGSRELLLNRFFERSGIGVDSLSQLTASQTSTFANGLILDIDARCDGTEFICREYSDDDAISIAFAHAVRYRANWWLIEDILKTNEINRYTMMNREYMWGKRNHFKAEFEKRIQWIAANIDMTSTDCFICRGNSMYVGGILL